MRRRGSLPALCPCCASAIFPLGLTMSETEKHPNVRELAADFFRRYGTTTIEGESHQTMMLWRGDYYVWDDGIYRMMDDEELKARIVMYLNGTTTMATPEVVSSMKLHLSPLALTYRERVPNTYMPGASRESVSVPVNAVAMKNGVITFTEEGSVSFSPPSPTFFTLTKLPYEYDPSAECGGWETFLEEATDGDVETMRLLKQFAGYVLLPSNPYQSFLLCIGDAGMGKGTYARTITSMIGDKNCSAVSLRRFSDQFSLYTTYGKMLNVVGDAGSELTPQVEEIVKQWTGDDMLAYEKKYGRTVHARATAKLLILANEFPSFMDKSNGTWRRLKIAKFYRPNAEVMDTGLGKKLLEELPGIFNWAVEGLKDLLGNGGFIVPPQSQEIWEARKWESNPAGMFLAETYRYDPLAEGTRTGIMYAAYKDWCYDSGYRPMCDKNFGKEISRLFPLSVRRRTREGGKRFHFYSGIVSL